MSDLPAVPTITVTGHGRVAVAPDRVVFAVKLEALTLEASATELELTRLRQRLLECLASAEVSRDHVRSSSIQLHPEHEFEEKRWKYRGIRGSEVVKIRVPLVPGRTTQILTSLANELRHLRVSVDYCAHDTIAASDDALRLAVANARRQAEVIASASGFSLGALRTATHRREPDDANEVAHDCFYEARGAPEIDPAQAWIDAAVETVWTLRRPRRRTVGAGLGTARQR